MLGFIGNSLKSFLTPAKRHPIRKPRRTRLTLEILESREMLDAGLTGTLTEGMPHTPPLLQPLPDLILRPADQHDGRVMSVDMDANSNPDQTLHYKIEHSPSPLNALAYDLDQSLGLVKFPDAAGYRFNIHGGEEKWLHSTVQDAWYFLLPSGTLHRYNGESPVLSAPAIATLSPAFAEEPRLLHDATPPQQSLNALAYDLDQNLGLRKYPDAAGYREDLHVPSAKWLHSTVQDAWFYLLEDGNLYKYSGGDPTIVPAPFAALEPDYWQDPSLLHEAKLSAGSLPPGVQVTIDSSSGEFHISTPSDFVGVFQVAVTASDGVDYVKQTFVVGVYNDPPELAPIADQHVHPGDTVRLTAIASDPNVGQDRAYAVSLDASPLAQQLHQLDQTLGLRMYPDAAGYREDLHVPSAKWLHSTVQDAWFYLLEDGNLYKYSGGDPTIVPAPFATLNPIIHQDPALLHDATAVQDPNAAGVQRTVDANGVISIISPASFVGIFQATATVTDGIVTANRTFLVNVSERVAPEVYMPERMPEVVLTTGGLLLPGETVELSVKPPSLAISLEDSIKHASRVPDLVTAGALTHLGGNRYAAHITVNKGEPSLVDEPTITVGRPIEDILVSEWRLPGLSSGTYEVLVHVNGIHTQTVDFTVVDLSVELLNGTLSVAGGDVHEIKVVNAALLITGTNGDQFTAGQRVEQIVVGNHAGPKIVIGEGQSMTVITPHHADHGHPGSPDTHFFAETGDAHHFAWVDADPATPHVIDIWYDFRNEGAFPNLITPAQIQRAEDAMRAWAAATNGQIRFQRNTTAPRASIINIGTGDLAALGGTSGPGGVLGLGGGRFTHGAQHNITAGAVWMDFAETWDTTIGNGNPLGTVDYFTVVAQEIGHALGLGHTDDLPGLDIMNGSYAAEQTQLSQNDIDHIRAVYGVQTFGTQFTLQTGTALHETGASFDFVTASNGDLFAVKKSGTGTNSTEVHVLSAASGYKAFSLHTGTALHETDGSWDFALAPNRDLFAIKKSGTGTNRTEIHVLSAASGYRHFSLQTGTALHVTNSTWEFALAPNRDLFAIKKSGTGTNSTEVHVLSAASGYQAFSLHTGTALHETDGNWEFALRAPAWPFFDRDLYAIKKSNTGTNTTEVHVLSAASGYKTFSRQTGTVLHETGSNFTFGITVGGDLFGVKKNGTGTNSTEVHIVDLP